jgi:hypothetical protein
MLQRTKGKYKLWEFGVLRRMFEPKMDEVKGKKKITYQNLHNL